MTHRPALWEAKRDIFKDRHAPLLKVCGLSLLFCFLSPFSFALISDCFGQDINRVNSSDVGDIVMTTVL